MSARRWSGCLILAALLATAAPRATTAEPPPPAAAVADSLAEAQRLFEQGEKAAAAAQYAEAERLLLRSVELRKQQLGARHKDLVPGLRRLAVVAMERADYPRADELFRQTLELAELTLEPAADQRNLTLANYGECYRRQGRYDEAEPLLLRALHNLDGKQPAARPLVVVLSTLGMLYSNRGDYPRGEQSLNRALDVATAVSGPQNPSRAPIMRALAQLFMRQGEYRRAAPQLEQVVAMTEKGLGPRHPRVAEALSDLGSLYLLEQDYSRAEPLYERALTIWETALGPAHPTVGIALNNLGLVASARGDLARAEKLFERSIEVREASLGPSHPDVLNNVRNLAELSLKRRDYQRAEPLYQRVLTGWQKGLGATHPLVGMAVHDLGRLRALQGRVDESVPLLRRAQEIAERRLRIEGPALDGQRLDGLLELLAGQQRTTLSLLRRYPRNRELGRLALDVLLLRKGRSLDEAGAASRAVYADASPADQRLFSELRALRSRYSSLSLAAAAEPLPGAGAETTETRLRLLADEIDRGEEDLAKRLLPVRARRSLPSLDQIAARVAAALPPDGTLVEFAVFADENLEGEGLPGAVGPLRVVALVIARDRELAALDLGPAAPIDAAVAALLAAVSTPRGDFHLATADAYSRILAPLRPLLDGRRQLFISADGQLNLVPFAALFDGKAGRFPLDDLTVTYVTSGRDLLPVSRPVARSEMVIVADPTFTAPPGRAGSGPLVAAALPPADERGFRIAKLQPLPGTRAEAMMLQKIWPGAKMLLGSEASEPALLELHAPRILHVATHGLFLADTPLPAGSRGFGLDQQPPPPNPLLRSALALAGAERGAQAGRGDTLEGPDGLVTALELSGMDLWGTELVVLSACDTARGDIHLGQGVYGLRRAVQVAGAESMVTSLWKVSDLVTRELMTGFYRGLRLGQGRGAALRNAALELRGRYPHPYYWASFIAFGNARPLAPSDRATR